MKEFKTNVMRILDQKHITYKVHEYENDGKAVDGVTVAKKTGLDPSCVFKTLIAVGQSKKIYVFVLPVQFELNLKKAAAVVHEKSISMVHVKDINTLTGYVRGGCSPIGMKKQYYTVFDDHINMIDNIAVSAGRIGSQVELSSQDLISLTCSEVASVV